jgi:hypothetical protein
VPIRLAGREQLGQVEGRRGVDRRRRELHGRHRRLRRPVDQRIEPGRERLTLLPEHIQATEDSRQLGLDLDHGLLQTGAARVPILREPLVVLEDRLLLLADGDRGVHVAEVVEDRLHLRDHVALPCVPGFERRRRVLRRDLAAQVQFAEPRERLPQHDGVELRSDAGLDAPQHLREGQGRVRQRGDLGHPLQHGPVPPFRFPEAGCASSASCTNSLRDDSGA